jgi:hypothetical protein
MAFRFLLGDVTFAMSWTTGVRQLHLMPVRDKANFCTVNLSDVPGSSPLLMEDES